MNEKTDLKN